MYLIKLFKCISASDYAGDSRYNQSFIYTGLVSLLIFYAMWVDIIIGKGESTGIHIIHRYIV